MRDETAAAVVDGEGRVLAHAVLSQIAEHVPYGGIVPEIAARAHLAHLDRLITKAMTEARVGYGDLAGVAATAGPGLIGGVIVGLMTAKAIAAVGNYGEIFDRNVGPGSKLKLDRGLNRQWSQGGLIYSPPFR